MGKASILLFIPFFLASFVLTTKLAQADITRLEVQSRCVGSNEYRLLVETSRTWRPLLSHSSKTSDVTCYLVSIDLTGEKPLAERSKVYGPLWSVPNERSSISYSAGANFTKADEEAAAATPGMLFDEEGKLLRFLVDPKQKKLLRHELEMSETKAAWKLQGDVKDIKDNLDRFSEDRCRTNTGRYKVIYQEGKAACFDCLTGEQIPDAWLEKAFSEMRSIPEFGNVRQFLTDDRQHLVASPEDIWRRNDNSEIEKFRLGGKKYQRSSFGMAYSRPDTAAQLFPRAANPQPVGAAPHAAISIGGELYLLEVTKATLRLYTPDQKKSFEIKSNDTERWVNTSFPRYQFLPVEKELVLFGEVKHWQSPDEVFAGLTRWQYETQTLTQVDFPVNELFEKRDGLLVPKKSIKIE